MNETVILSLVAASGTFLTAITALLLNNRGFTSIERRLEVLERDVKEFYRMLGLHDTESGF